MILITVLPLFAQAQSKPSGFLGRRLLLQAGTAGFPLTAGWYSDEASGFATFVGFDGRHYLTALYVLPRNVVVGTEIRPYYQELDFVERDIDEEGNYSSLYPNDYRDATLKLSGLRLGLVVRKYGMFGKPGIAPYGIFGQFKLAYDNTEVRDESGQFIARGSSFGNVQNVGIAFSFGRTTIWKSGISFESSVEVGGSLWDLRMVKLNSDGLLVRELNVNDAQVSAIRYIRFSNLINFKLAIGLIAV